MEKWWEARVQALEAEKASERPRKNSYEMPRDDEDRGKELNAEVNEDNEVNDDNEENEVNVNMDEVNMDEVNMDEVNMDEVNVNEVNVDEANEESTGEVCG